jgi:hypothetical protein
MKISHLALGSFILALTASSAFADSNLCDGDNSLHCIYTAGVQPGGTGKYIKIQGASFSYTLCWGDGSVSFGSKDQLSAALTNGENKITFSVCKDLRGQNCDMVATDPFVVSGSAGSYQAQPKTYALDLSAVINNNNYPTCNIMSQAKKRHF